MIYLGDSKVDLSNGDLVEFLQSGNVGSLWQWPLAKIPGYQQSTVKPFDLGVAMASADVPWTVVQYWSLLDKGQEINKFKIETTASKKIKIISSIALYIKDGLTQGVQERIENAFKAYSLASGDVDTYAEIFLRSNPDVSPFSFGCSLNYTIEILTDATLDNSKENFIRLRLKENYSIRLIREEHKKGEFRPVRGPNELICPKDKDNAKVKSKKRKTHAAEESQQIQNSLEIEFKGHVKNPPQCDPLKDVKNDVEKNLELSGCMDNKTSV